MRRIHYAWFVCLGGTLAAFVTMGLNINVFSIYQPEIIRLNHFTNAQGSLITTIRSLFILAALMTVNQLCSRLGERYVLTLGVLLCAASRLCFGLARSFPVYCCAAALAGLAYCYGGMVPTSLMLNRWFRHRQRMALGIASAGSGVSNVLAPLLITRVMAARGLRASFLLESLVMAVLALLVWLLVRTSPERLGLEPYQRQTEQDSGQSRGPGPGMAMSRGQRLAVLLAALLAGGPGGPAFSHLGVLFTSEGYSSTLVAGLITYLGAVILVGKITLGQIYDRFGGRRGNHYVFGMLMAGLGLCCLAPLGGYIVPVLAITAIGLGVCLSGVSPTQWAMDLSGEQYQGNLRAISMAHSAGMLLFGPIPGAMADRWGSYVPAYALFVLFALASMVILQTMYRRLSVPSPTG
ncbi:MAG: MFS transporter [Lawsonibacter sp.]|nr:MFS transporter [Lawsonibacter sp.]